MSGSSYARATEMFQAAVHTLNPDNIAAILVCADIGHCGTYDSIL